VVEVLKPRTPQDYLDEVAEMSRETDAILKASAQLIREVEILLEENRRLRASQQALLDDREKNKRID
jgi:hypothetical protein